MLREANWESASATVRGYVAAGYEAVAHEFERNFTERGEVGAAFAALRDGVPVVDLWGGQAAPGRPWRRDTLQVIFSGTKGLVAACVLKLVEEGRLDLAAPVARYWPEFARNGKDRVRVRHVVSHTAGLPGVVAPLAAGDLVDQERIADLLAAQPLPRDPDAFNAYHALTIGWIVSALVQRIDGRTAGCYFAQEVAGPLGLDAWIGLPEAEEGRVGRLELGPGMGPWDLGLSEEQKADPVRRSVWANPPLFEKEPLAWNSRPYHSAEIAGGGGIADARSVARFYGCMACGGELDGVRILRPETVALGRRPLSFFTDPYIAEDMAFGVMWALQTPQRRFGPVPEAFGHTGAGGSIHGAWPRQRVGFSYVMNQLRGDPEDLRSRPLLAALHEAVGDGRP